MLIVGDRRLWFTVCVDVFVVCIGRISCSGSHVSPPSSSSARAGRGCGESCAPPRRQAPSSVREADHRVPSQSETALRPPAARRQKDLEMMRMMTNQNKCTYLVSRVVILAEVWMCERLIDRDSIVRIEGQHPLEQIQGPRIGLGEHARKGNLGLVRQRLQIGARLHIVYAIEIILRGRAQHVQNVIQLVEVWAKSVVSIS